MKKFLAAVLLSLSLIGCAGIKVESPKEGIAACYITVRATFSTAADLKARGVLAPEQEAKIVTAGDQALAACDAARVAFSAGDVTAADSQLKLANALLLQFEAMLKAKGVQ